MNVKSRGELGFAGLLLALGIFVPFDTSTIDIPKAASNVGPRFFPYAVGILLTGAAAVTFLNILREDHAEPEEGELIDPNQPVNVRRVTFFIGAVVAFGLLIEPLGYVPATALSFFAVAAGLGVRHYARLADRSVLIALVIYVAFTRGLGIYLPPGLLDGIL